MPRATADNMGRTGRNMLPQQLSLPRRPSLQAPSLIHFHILPYIPIYSHIFPYIPIYRAASGVLSNIDHQKKTKY